MDFIITFINFLFTALTFAIIARALISWVPVDPYNPAIRILDQITEPILAPLRRIIPPIGGAMDISPIVAIVLIQIIQSIVVGALTSVY